MYYFINIQLHIYIYMFSLWLRESVTWLSVGDAYGDLMRINIYLIILYEV